jgi:hypothetical protein
MSIGDAHRATTEGGACVNCSRNMGMRRRRHALSPPEGGAGTAHTTARLRWRCSFGMRRVRVPHQLTCEEHRPVRRSARYTGTRRCSLHP